MSFADIPPFIQTVLGVVAGAGGAYMAIRERLAILETKHATEIAAIYKHIGSLESNANRAHQRIDTLRHHD